MNSIRKHLNNNKIIKVLSSVKIAVVCLSLLFILVFWGTIDQVSNGLYLAQEKFFNSWVFTFWGFLPFPGARLVLWVLFINLVCASITRLFLKWSKPGIIIIHTGLLTFFVAAFVTFHSVEESNITLMEGEGTNVATAYHNWELSLWRQEGNEKKVIAFDADRLRKGDSLEFKPYGISVVVNEYHRNCNAYGSNEGVVDSMNALSVSGIQSLKSAALQKEPEKNIAGGIFRIQGADQGEIKVLLFGGDSKPVSLIKGDDTFYLKLRKKRAELPFVLKLKNFVMERHPNTNVARSYESLVDVVAHHVSREVLISMNEPMRHKNYTLYQASYAIDEFGRELSTLAVVKNSGRLLPYIATFLTFAGLVVHFLAMAFQPKLKVRRKKK